MLKVEMSALDNFPAAGFSRVQKLLTLYTRFISYCSKFNFDYRQKLELYGHF